MTLIRYAAWGLLIAIAIVTVGPIGFRPESGAPVQLDRAFACAGMGVAFVLAYPRHLWRVAIILVVGAVGLELAQHLTPGRHGRAIDAVAKICGGGFGMAMGCAILWLRQLMRPTASN